MSIEDDLRNVRPALDRAIHEAAMTAPSPAPRASRARVAVAAFAVAAAVAATVGVVAHLDAGGGHGAGVRTGDTGGSTTLASTSTSPVPSTSTSTAPDTTTTTQPGVPLQSVDWPSVAYPMAPHCGHAFSTPVSVGQVAYSAPAPGVELAVVLVRCTVGAGTPPVVVYVYDGAPSTRSPHLAETLVTDSDGWQASTFDIVGDTIKLVVHGFSSGTIPNCCPDVQATFVWQWSGSDYRLLTTIPPHIPGPAFGGY